MSLWVVGEQHICIVAALKPRISVPTNKETIKPMFSLLWWQKLICNTADMDNKQYVSCCQLQVTAE